MENFSKKENSEAPKFVVYVFRNDRYNYINTYI